MNCVRWLLLILFSIHANAANPIPSGRMIDWLPGISGGTLPTFSTVIDMSAAPYSVVGDGTTDNSAKIASAITAASAGTRLQFPAGNFKFTAQIFVDKALEIVGAGTNAGGTRFTMYDATTTSGGSIYFRGYSSSTYATVGAVNRGQTVITLADASAISTNSWVIVMQDNSAAYLEGNVPGGLTTTSAYYHKQWVKVLSKAGNVLTIDRPLFLTYGNGTLNTRVQRMVPLVGAGIRDIYVHQLGTRDSTINMFQTVGCFVSGVRSTNANFHHVSLDNSYQATIQNNHWNKATTYGQGGYGISVTGSTDCLVQNNIMPHLRHSIIIQNGAAGNVVFANYSDSMYDVNGDGNAANYLMPDYEIHGGNANFNLVTMNKGQRGGQDDYWGINHNNTWYRNHFTRVHKEKGNQINSGLVAFFLNALNSSNNIVGNVWGLNGLTGAATDTTWGVNQYAPTYGDSLDERVASTWIWHANYNQITWAPEWDSANADHVIPTSIWPSAKPSWWGDCDWPPYGPDKFPASSVIPAEAWGIEQVAYPYYSSVAVAGGAPPPPAMDPECKALSSF